jgi:hypothetical protein
VPVRVIPVVRFLQTLGSRPLYQRRASEVRMSSDARPARVRAVSRDRPFCSDAVDQTVVIQGR